MTITNSPTLIKRPSPVVSPFSLASPGVSEAGYSPIPLIPNEKRPGHWRGETSGWKGMVEWSKHAEEKPADWLLAQWDCWPGANIGVIHTSGFIAIDFDNDPIGCHDGIKAVLAKLPGTIVRRKGSKGYIQYFRSEAGTATKVFRTDEGNALEVLGAGRQSVLPPSIHPSGDTYIWITDETLEDTDLKDLPHLTPEAMEEIIQVLKDCGWDERRNDELNQPVGSRGKGGGFYGWVNGVAMSELGKWVQDLGLDKTRTKVNGGWEAVPEWRGSGTGKALVDRKRSLKIDPKGIKDFGTDEPYTPIGLVMAALGMDAGDALMWLFDRVCEPFPDWKHADKAKQKIAARASELAANAVANDNDGSGDDDPNGGGKPVKDGDIKEPHIAYGDWRDLGKGVSLNEARKQMAEMFLDFKDVKILEMQGHIKKQNAAANVADLAIMKHDEMVACYGEEGDEAKKAKAEMQDAKAKERAIVENPPSVWVAEVSPGVGKTYEAAKLFDGNCNIMISHPTNKLNDEFAEHMKKHGLDGYLQKVRGPDAEDYCPKNMALPEDNRQKMCIADESTSELIKCSGQLSQACGTEENRCAHFDSCGIQSMLRSMNGMMGGGLYATNHARLAGPKFPGVDRDNPIEALIFDENGQSAFSKGIGEGGAYKGLPVEEFSKDSIPAGDADTHKAAMEIMPVVGDIIRGQWAAKQALRINRPENSGTMYFEEIGIRWLDHPVWSKASLYYDNKRRDLLLKMSAASTHYRQASNMLLAGFEPNMSGENSRKVAKDISGRATFYTAVSALLSAIGGVLRDKGTTQGYMQPADHMAGRFVAYEYRDKDGKVELRLKHLGFASIDEGVIGSAAVLYMNGKPEPEWILQELFRYDVTVGGVFEGIKERRYKVNRTIKRYDPVVAEIDHRVNITYVDGGPTSVASLALFSDFKAEAAVFEDREEGKWPDFGGKPDKGDAQVLRTGFKNRVRVLKFVDDLANTSSGPILLCGKKSLMSWVECKKGPEPEPTIDYLSYGRTSGTNDFKDHHGMVLWGYDRIDTSALANMVGAVTGEFVEDRKSIKTNSDKVHFYGDSEGGKAITYHQYEHAKMRGLETCRRHSTVLQAVERLRLRTPQNYDRKVFIAVRGSIPFEVDSVLHWGQVRTDITLGDKAEEHKKLMAGGGIMSNWRFMEAYQKGSFRDQIQLQNCIKSMGYRKGNEWGRTNNSSNKVIDSIVENISASPLLELKLREVGSKYDWSTCYHDPENGCDIKKLIRSRLGKAGITVQFKMDEKSIIDANDLPISWRGIMGETGTGERTAKAIATNIQAGLLDDTHRAVGVREVKNGKPFGRVMRRMMRRNTDVLDLIKMNPEVYKGQNYAWTVSDLPE